MLDLDIILGIGPLFYFPNKPIDCMGWFFECMSGCMYSLQAMLSFLQRYPVDIGSAAVQ